MALVKFKDSFPSFLDEFFGGDIFSSTKNSSFIGNSLPAVNVKENNTNFQLEVAAPGMKKGDFKIELENNILGISSETREEKTEEEENYTRREFSYSSFRRTFSLPETVNEDDISAKYDNGVLKITIPKKELQEVAKSRLISIN